MFRPSYIIILLIVFFISLFGSLITNNGMAWYNKLLLPSFTPSGAIIGAVWTVVFILSAISVLIYWNKAYRNLRFIVAITLFIINGILNVLWSYLFFGLHLVGASILEMIILEATVIALIFLVRYSSKRASILLYPYAIWVAFATSLAYRVLLLNT